MFCLEGSLPYFAKIEASLIKRISPTVHFVNTNLPEERVRVLLPEKEISEPNIAQMFSRDQMLIVMWKDQLQHSALENTVF